MVKYLLTDVFVQVFSKDYDGTAVRRTKFKGDAMTHGLLLVGDKL